MKSLTKAVFHANMELPKHELVSFTWGNVSGINRKRGLVVIKPSGVEYEKLTFYDMVPVDTEGNVLQGKLRPSVDLPTHLSLYKSFPEIGGIVHTHSPWATIYAQCGMDIQAFGTTHADHFYGSIPCTRALSDDEVAGDYEENTGLVIAETFRVRGINPLEMPGVIVKNHGPFAWGATPAEAVKNAAILEKVAFMAYHTQVLAGTQTVTVSPTLLKKHYERKHGKNSKYGQAK